MYNVHYLINLHEHVYYLLNIHAHVLVKCYMKVRLPLLDLLSTFLLSFVPVFIFQCSGPAQVDRTEGFK